MSATLFPGSHALLEYKLVAIPSRDRALNLVGFDTHSMAAMVLHGFRDWGVKGRAAFSLFAGTLLLEALSGRSAVLRLP